MSTNRAVSYTHLDVYKRQAYGSIRRPFIWWFPGFVNEFDFGQLLLFRKVFVSQYSVKKLCTVTVPFQPSTPVFFLSGVLS